MAKARDPFDVPLTAEQRQDLALFLSRELQAGLDAKGSQEQEVDYWHTLYEQARTRLGRSAPWPDAADLTSYLASEKVDALHARLMRTIWVEPVWTVEGWGEAADRAPFVEEFHQWKAEEERLQAVLDQLALISLIEPRGLLEVFEGSDSHRVRKQQQVKVQTDPLTGSLVYDDEGQPALQRDEQGKLMEATGDGEPAALAVIDTDDTRTGPQYRVIPYRDSVILPGHARDQLEIWCYGKRFWKLSADLKRQADEGLYDVEEVAKLTDVGDRESDAALERARQAVAPQETPTAEKELWELLVRIDLRAFFTSRGKKSPMSKALAGPRWYLATVHKDQGVLLRLQHDDVEHSRYVLVNLFPRTDRCTEGFSLIGHKLITTIEEHTAWRNMAADRASMVVQAPIKRLQGALWDPVEQPWGPKAVIDVRDMREVEPMTVPDNSAPVFEHMQMLERNAERIVGVNDIASGQVLQQSKTLGEVQMATEQSFVRMDLIVRRFQDAMEPLAQIRHAIWKRALAEQKGGVPAPQSLIVGLEGRGVSIDEFLPDGKITAALLDGPFRFKPHGSVETADLSRLRTDFTSAIQFLPALLQSFPLLVPMFQSPQAARAMGRAFVRLFRLGSPQAFLGSPAQDLQQGLPGAPMLPTMPGMMPPPSLAPPVGMLPPPPGPLPPMTAPSTNTLQ